MRLPVVFQSLTTLDAWLISVSSTVSPSITHTIGPGTVLSKAQRLLVTPIGQLAHWQSAFPRG